MTNKNEDLIQTLGGKGENLVEEHIDKGENILVKLQGSFGEALVITEKRLYVIKWGWMAGNMFGGRCVAFEYGNITGLEIKKNLATGTFEVLTPATQNSQKSYWGDGDDDAIKSDNVIAFNGQSQFNLFQEATKIGREQINKFHSKGNRGQSDLQDLEKLAELKDKGIITKKEFEAKKKQILGL